MTGRTARAALAALAAVAVLAVPAAAADGTPLVRPGEALVVVRDGARLATALAAPGVLSAAVVREYPRLPLRGGGRLALVRSGEETGELVKRLRRTSGVAGAWPNFVRRASVVPDDPLFGGLWGLQNTGQTVLDHLGVPITGTPGADVKAPAAWDLATGSPDVVVGVIDTGVDFTHEDLAQNVWVNPGEIPGNGLDDDGNGWVDDVHGVDAANGDGCPLDDEGHGTHVAGTIAAAGDNGIGVAGVGWRTRVMALKFLDFRGEGADADAIACIEYAIEARRRGVNVVALNASWGGWGGEEGDPLSLAIAAAGEEGIAFVAAAGNVPFDNDTGVRHGYDYLHLYPAYYGARSLVAVAASDPRDQRAAFSTFGARSVDLAAPGVGILSTVPGGGYVPGAGAGDLFLDDVEGGGGAFAHGGYRDGWGVAGPGAGGSALAWVHAPVPADGYGAESWVGSATDLDVSRHADRVVSLGFAVSADLPEGAGASLSVEVSPNAGLDWSTLGTLGRTSGWEPHCLTVPLESQSSRFRVRFRLVVPPGVATGAVAIDDVGVGFAPASNSYASLAGTSMAAPHVSGALALAAALFPEESVLARINRVLSGVEEVPALHGLVRTGGRLDVGRALLPDPPIRPWLFSAAPERGATWGAAFSAAGVGFGAAAGAAVFCDRLAPSARTARFLFRFELRTNDDGIVGDGVHLDDVRVFAPDREFFSDDMELGAAKWPHAGYPADRWAVTGETAHSGASSWSDSPGGGYDGYSTQLLEPVEAIDLSGAGADDVRIGFWARIQVREGDSFTLRFSPDGGATWEEAAALGRSMLSWRYFEFPVPGACVERVAPVAAWGDGAMAGTVPAGAGRHLRLRGASGGVSLEHATLTAWRPGARAPRGHGYAAHAALDARVYLLGAHPIGEGGAQPTDVYDAEADAWSTPRALRLPRRRVDHAAAALGRRLYVVGGAADDAGFAPVREVDSVDPRTGAWRVERPLPIPLANARAAALGRRLHVTGGERPDNGEAVRAHLSYEPATRRWRRLASMAAPRTRHAVAAVGGRLYVFGGYDPEGFPLATAEVYDPATNAWSPLPDIPGGPLAAAAAAADGRRIHLVGGSSYRWMAGSTRYLVFDTGTGRWLDTLGSILEPRFPREGAALSYLPGRGLVLAAGWIGGAAPFTARETELLDSDRIYEAATPLTPDGGGRPFQSPTGRRSPTPR